MRRKEQLIDHGLIKLFLFALVMLTPFTSWAQTLTVGGIGPNEQGNFIDPTNEQTIAGVTFDSEANKLTLSNGASVGQIIYSGTSDLTIAFSGTCSITTEDNFAIQYGGAGSERPQLTFSLTNESTTGALNISGYNSAIEGFSDVDFGNLNLASRSAQGVYYDKSNNLMSGNGGNPSDLKITTETYYPIWIHDSSISSTGYSHTQLSEGATSVAVGGGTVSFDGNHTITISNVAFNYEDNNMIVVGPSMTELTVKLDGTSSARDGSTVLGLWKSTPLTFTTNASTPGSLTGYGIVSWNGDGNGQITYQNGLKVFYDVDVPGKEIISTTGTYIKIGDTPITGTTTTVEGYEGVSFDASTNTLTLNKATITVNGKDAIVSQLDNLTVFLVGDQNIITCHGGDDCAFKGTGSKTVTFATNSSEAGSLIVYVSNEAQLYSNITPIYTGLSIKNNGDSYTIKSDSYALWIGDTQVTDANKDHILGEGNETVTFSVTGTTTFINTLTLNGATLTVPIKVGGTMNLNIDIKGTNTITTTENCIQKIGDTSPSVNFLSTSDEVGSLSLKGSSGVYGVGYGTFTISEKFAVILMKDDRYYSNQYWFTDGSTKEAMLTPSYGITVGGMQIGKSNADNVTGEGIGDGTDTGMVSYDRDKKTLTLNGATISVGNNSDYPITSSLPDLIIKLIGNNTATVNNDYPIFVHYNGNVDETSPQLTFQSADREVNIDEYGTPSVSFGKLTVNLDEIGSLASGYTLTQDIAGAIDEYYTGNSCWSANVTSGSMALTYVEAYDLWYGGNRVISTNLFAGVSGAPYFNPETNTILLKSSFSSGPIKSKLDELTIQVNGNVSLNPSGASPAIQYTGTGTGKLTFTCASASTPTSLTLNADNTGAASSYTAIDGFTSSNIIFTSPMKLASPSSSELLTATTVKVANCDFYGLTIAETEVTSLNKDNILAGTANDDKVSYNDGTLTLNGAAITGAIYVYEGPLTVSLSGNNTLTGTGNDNYAFMSEVGGALNFVTDASAPGQLLMKGYTEAYVQNVLTDSYANGLGFTIEDGAMAIATLPTLSPEGGVYWTDQKFTISGNTGATLGYTDGVDTYTAYTAPFTLNVGSQTLYPYSLVTDETNTVHVRPAEGQIYYIYNKPGFSVAAGTYDEAQNITLTNLPATLPEGADAYPQVWYFLGDDDNDDSNDIRITSATQTIEVNESTKVSAYILDGDSSKKKKSEVVEAEYVIRQDPNLQFVQDEKAVTAAEYTIGGTDNPALPTLKNTNEVAVTYESSDPAVATVDTDGTVTPVGVGTTTITASCVQSETILADEASYTLNVYKNLSHSSITIDVAEATYNGEALEPAVTVKDGETSIADFVSVAYANNTNAASSTAETAPTVTVTAIMPGAESGLEINWYKGSAQKTFTIAAANITDLYDISLEKTSYVYDGTEHKPAVVFMMDNEPVELSADDYEMSYSNNVNVGSADATTGAPTVTVTGKGNYTGSADKMFTINKAQLTVTPDDKTYNVGDDITLTVSYEGFVNGETETVLTTQPTASYGTADVTKPGRYEITASGGVAQNYDFIYKTGTLTVNRQLNVSFSASNTWATYCGTENLSTPVGLKAYQVTAVEGATVTISEIGYIPANTAVLLQNVSNNNVWTNIAASAYTGATSTFENNKLIGTASAVDVSTITGGTVYILVNNMFRRSTSGSIPANRGYLVVATSSNAPQLSISIGDDTTGIGMVGCDSVATDNDEWYTLDGQKLQQAPTQKGLYIKNGKKVIINKK